MGLTVTFGEQPINIKRKAKDNRTNFIVINNLFGKQVGIKFLTPNQA
jgi:hypothetical protein